MSGRVLLSVLAFVGAARLRDRAETLGAVQVGRLLTCGVAACAEGASCLAKLQFDKLILEEFEKYTASTSTPGPRTA